MPYHYAQILSICIKTHITRSYKVFERQLNEENMQKFLHLLQQESWQDVYREVDANIKFNKFLDNFMYYCDIAFLIWLIPKREAIRKRWISQGIKNSSRRMRILDKQRKEMKVGKEDCQFIKNYRRINRKVINEAKKRDNDNYIANAKNKTKASWQIINYETGKTISNKNIELNLNSSKITNPKMVSEIFNTYFVDIVEK
jgi:hypothetical protein